MTGYPDFTFAALLRSLIGGMEATGHEEEAALPNETHYDKIHHGVYPALNPASYEELPGGRLADTGDLYKAIRSVWRRCRSAHRQ